MNNISRSGPRVDKDLLTGGIKESESTQQNKKIAEAKSKDTLEKKKGTIPHDEYKANMKQPILQAPDKDIKTELTHPQQRAVKYEFERYVGERLQVLNIPESKQEAIRTAIMDPSHKVGLDANSLNLAKKIEKDANQVIQDRFNLNSVSSWNIHSKDKANWIPTKPASTERTLRYTEEDKKRIVESYNNSLEKNIEIYIKNAKLTPEMIAALRAGVKTGIVPENVQPDFDFVYKLTVNNIRTEFLLPNIWIPDTKDPKAWMALPVGSVDPQLTNELHLKSFLNNMSDFYTEVAEVSQKNNEIFPPEDQLKFKNDRIGVFSILRIIERALREFQLRDAEAIEKITKNQFGRPEKELKLGELIDEFNIQIEKDNAAAAHKSYVVNVLVQVAFYSISAVITIISVVAALKTGSASVIVGAVVIGIALTAMSATIALADWYFGISEKLMEFVTELTDRMLQGQEQWVKDVLVKLIVAVTILVIVIFTAAVAFLTKVGGGIAAKKGAALISMALKISSKLAFRQAEAMVIQIAFVYVDIGCRLLIPFSRACGASEEQAEKISQYTHTGVACLFGGFMLLVSAYKGLAGLKHIRSSAKNISTKWGELKESWSALIKTFASVSKDQKGELIVTFMSKVDYFLRIFPLDTMVQQAGDIAQGEIQRSSKTGVANKQREIAGLEANLSLARDISQLIDKHLKEFMETTQKGQDIIANFNEMINRLIDKQTSLIGQLHQAA